MSNARGSTHVHTTMTYHQLSTWFDDDENVHVLLYVDDQGEL